MLVHVVQFWRILIIIKLQRLRSTRAVTCIIQIVQELELEPALLNYNQKDWESFKLNHKHSYSPQVQVGLQQHLSL